MFKYLVSILFASTSLVSQTLVNDNGWRPAWGIDRIDQRSSMLDDRYNYRLNGSGVTVYVFDSGVNSSHEEFGGRVQPGFTVINDGYGFEDCAGHGTHTASLVGGSTYGVAKAVTIVPVRVLNCSNGNSSSATLYTAINWIIEHHQAGTPAIVNMSVGMTKSIALNDAVKSLIADGLIVVAAAGNQNRDACLYSPGSEPSAITVGAIDRADVRATYSNWGSCIDIFAPGSDLVGAWVGSPSTYRSSSGTSNAAPIVSGLVALMLQESPGLTQEQVQAKLNENATRDVLFNIGTGSPNLLAYSRLDGAVALPPSTTTPSASTTIPAATTTVPVQTTVPVATTTVQTTSTTIAPRIVPGQVHTCSVPGMRVKMFAVPYVCVNTGSKLMLVPQRYSPGRP